MKFEIDVELAKAIIENANFVYCELHNFAQDIEAEDAEDATALQEYADNLEALVGVLKGQLGSEDNDAS